MCGFKFYISAFDFFAWSISVTFLPVLQCYLHFLSIVHRNTHWQDSFFPCKSCNDMSSVKPAVRHTQQQILLSSIGVQIFSVFRKPRERFSYFNSSSSTRRRFSSSGSIRSFWSFLVALLVFGLRTEKGFSLKQIKYFYY